MAVDPTPFFTKYGNNSWAAVKTYQDAQVDYAAAPVIKKYTGVLAAADVYTASTAFIILESVRLDTRSSARRSTTGDARRILRTRPVAGAPGRVRRYATGRRRGLRAAGDRDEALRVLRAAVAAGVDHIDTAQYYGPGTVNQLIREALHPYPDDLAIVSKVAARRDTDRVSVARRLRQGIEDNLATLGTEPAGCGEPAHHGSVRAPGRQFDAQLAALIKARDDGLIDGIGLSNISRPHLLRAADQTEIVCVQNLFNLADQRSLDVLTECEARAIAFVPFCPLGLPGEQRHRLLTDPDLATLGARLGASPAQLALAWLLDLAPNILLIPGTRTRSHLAENLAAADVKLDDAARTGLGRLGSDRLRRGPRHRAQRA